MVCLGLPVMISAGVASCIPKPCVVGSNPTGGAAVFGLVTALFEPCAQAACQASPTNAGGRYDVASDRCWIRHTCQGRTFWLVTHSAADTYCPSPPIIQTRWLAWCCLTPPRPA